LAWHSLSLLQDDKGIALKSKVSECIGHPSGVIDRFAFAFERGRIQHLYDFSARAKHRNRALKTRVDTDIDFIHVRVLLF
jgi:hypothetical protein